MSIRTWLGTAGLTALAVGNFGCGDDDGGGGGVSGSKKVSTLSRTEQIALCKDQASNIVALSKASNEINCTAEGLAAADECDDVREDCIDQSETLSVADERANCEDDEDDEGLEDCDASVSEVKACISAWVKLVNQTADDLTCDTTEEDLDDIDLTTRPTACEKILDTCPEVADLFGE